jgi:hypothetical protein
MYMAFDGMLDKDPNGGTGRNTPVDASDENRLVSLCLARRSVDCDVETLLLGTQKERIGHCNLPYLPWQPLIQALEMA